MDDVSDGFAWRIMVQSEKMLSVGEGSRHGAI
jgi:hypothetical protein